MSLTNFLSLAREYVTKERDAELEEAREYGRNPPSPLARLRVIDTTPGFRANEALVALAPTDGSRLTLDASELSCGDIVEIRLRTLTSSGKSSVLRVATRRVGGKDDERKTSRTAASSGQAGLPLKGLVWRMTGKVITVAVAALYEYDDEYLDTIMKQSISLVRMFNNETYYRMERVLRDMEALENGDNPVLDVLFRGKKEPSLNQDIQAKVKQAISEKEIQSFFNVKQLAAIELAVCADEIALIHGPPGTGKTRCIAESIYQCVQLRKERILAIAPSNIAADHLVETLAERYPYKLRLVRVGNPTRMSSAVIENSLEALVDDNFRGIGRDIRKDIDTLQRGLRRRGQNRKDRGNMKRALRELFQELKTRERSATKFVLRMAHVVVTTCAGVAHRALANEKFDSVFIDESAQALEPIAWIGILRSRRCVLAGDNCQLAPVTRSELGMKLSKNGELTVFERAQRVLPVSFKVLLVRQYRMNQIICQWSNETMYRNALETDTSVASILPKDLCLNNHDTSASPLFAADLSSPIIFIDTAGCDFEESNEDDLGISHSRRVSKQNTGEANIVVAHVESLLAAGIAEQSIKVIAPYSAQVRKLKTLLSENVEVATVDGFQGRESDIIVLSLVRSNSKRDVGFVADHRRLNVALTRAKRQVCLIGDSATIASSPLLASLLEYVEKRTLGDYRSAWSYA